MNSSGLDESRAVQLLAVSGGGIIRIGSGYLVAGDLVLTAAHVVVGADTVIVRRVVGRQQVREFTAVTEWADAGADVAVLRGRGGGDDESARVGDLPPLRYGRVGDGSVSCQALGFPWFKLRPYVPSAGAVAEWYRDTHHAIGTIATFSNLRQGTLELTVAPPERDPDPQQSPWRGMSGAAVFADGALIGVISEHHRSDGLGRLTAQRVRDWYGPPPERFDRLRKLLGLPEFGLLDWVGTGSAKSHYLDKVVRRDIAPEALYDREAELAELTRFCTDDDPGAPSYVWWRGPAWSGKSALLSWFALNPPPGVRTVAFFLRAHVPHQNTWIDVVDNLLQQVAAVAAKPVPTGLADSTRQEVLLALMDEAAETCRRRGERLVLVLDGLDEDQGDHGVAWLLPAEPAAGMRVIVSGRDHPPLPDGVLDERHPLRDEAVVRALAGSEHAKLMEQRAVAEINRLAGGSDLEKLLLALVAAARSGLSRADLAFLADCDEFEVGRQLGGVTGRTFTVRASRYRPDVGPRLYVLAHRDLPAMVEDRLGEAPLHRARRRLHAWNDGFRSRRWPVDTPEYLLNGYFDMLSETGDVDRMVACATDPARQYRMLDVTGGDIAALTEVTAAQEAVLGPDDPDLLAMTRLAVHRTVLVERNVCLSERLPVVWARLGNPVRAESLARSISQPSRRAFALSLLATWAAEVGDFERVKTLIVDVAEPVWRAESLTAAVRAAADRGEAARAAMFADEAESAVAAITDQRHRAQVSTALALAVAHTGDVDRAAGIAGAIRDSGEPVSESLSALSAVAEAVAATGDVGRAQALADAIADPAGRAAAVARIAFVLAWSGDLDGVQSVAATISDATWRAEALFAAATAASRAGNPDDAEAITETIAKPDLWVAGMTLAASAAAVRGEPARAVEMVQRAEAVVATLPDPTRRWGALLELSAVFAQAGDLDRAEAIVRSRTDPAEYRVAAYKVAPVVAVVDIDRAEALADAVADPFGRAEVLRKVATAAGERDEPARAIAVLRRAETAAAEIADPYQRAAMTAGMALIAARNGDIAYRDALISAIGDPELMSTTLRALAMQAAHAGNADAVAAIASVAIASRMDLSWLLMDAAEAAAAAGRLDAAEAIARSVNDPRYGTFVHIINRQYKVQALATVANAAAQAGERTRAIRLADDAETLASAVAPQISQWALAAMATAIATAGDIDSGAIVATYLADAETRSRTLADVCEVAAQAGDPDSAESIATAITDPSKKAVALASAGRARARAGDRTRAATLAKQAESIAFSVKEPYERMGVLMAMVARAAGGDDVQAREWAGHVDALAHSLPDNPRKQGMLAGAAAAVATAGDSARAEAIAAHIDDPDRKAGALASAAQAIAQAGDHGRAESLVGTIGEPGIRVSALATVAMEVSKAGDHPTAVTLAERAWSDARSIGEDRLQDEALGACVVVLARAGEIDRAETIARVAGEPSTARLWARLAEAATPLRARRALARALALGGSWAWLLPTLAKVDPATVRAIVDEFVTVLGPTD
ncbi:MAG: trypsin-like peptidase domain-containing protein [Catenulispora sp.]